VQGGGLVNEQNSFWIRGQRSNSPDVLVLVDGQERDFAVLSSHEVESITVLKDAAATALYGMRAGSELFWLQLVREQRENRRLN
jgi:TonB-dependent SusC/RagA subfamily outer membrane receptor